MMQQCTTLAQYIHDFVVGFENMLTGKQWRIGQIGTVAGNRVGNFQIVFVTHHEVFLTMTRCSMNSTGTGVGGNVITQYHRNSKVIERVMETQ